MDDTLFYKPSGRFSPAAPFLMLAAGIPAGLLLGAIYGVVDFYSPIIYLNVILLGAVGWILGEVVLKIARRAHVRNAWLAGSCGLVAGVSALYAAWVAWIFVLGDRTSDSLFFNPAQLLELANYLAVDGVWSLGSSGGAVNGIFLKAIWCVEALALVGFATVFPALNLARTPYSEATGQWADNATELPPLAAVEAGERKAFRKKLQQGEFETLGQLKPLRGEATSFTVATGRTTSPPGDEVFLTLETVDVVTPKKGDPQIRKTCLARNMIVDAAAWMVMAEIAGSGGGDAGTGGGPAPAEDDADEPVKSFPGLGPAAGEEAAPTSPPKDTFVKHDGDDNTASPHGLPGMPPAP